MKYYKKLDLLLWHIALIAALRNANWNRFHALLFDRVTEGWWFFIHNANFSDCELFKLPGKFLGFKKCSFRRAVLIGANFMPARFENCAMQGIDLRHANGYVEFVNCDLRGAKFDEKTILFPRERTDKPSFFENCKLDKDFVIFLKNQGVSII